MNRIKYLPRDYYVTFGSVQELTTNLALVTLTLTDFEFRRDGEIINAEFTSSCSEIVKVFFFFNVDHYE